MRHHDWEQARQLLQGQHPFLPDRQWLSQLDTPDWEVLWVALQQPERLFSSLQLYLEVWDKPVPCLQFRSQEGLVLYALQGEIMQGWSMWSKPDVFFQVQQVEAALGAARSDRARYPQAWVIRADIRAFFRSIAHQHLLAAHLERLPPVWAGVLNCYIQALDRLQQAQMPEYFRLGYGIPLGLELHYLLAHNLLFPVDQAIRSSQGMLAYTRYLDDMLIFVESEPAASAALSSLSGALEALELNLNLHKTRVHPPGEAVVFLGAELA